MKLHNIEQQTPAWFYLKKGIVSGTDTDAIFQGTAEARKKMYYKKVAEMLSTGTNERTQDPRDRGNELEDEARAYVELVLKKSILTTGFCQSEEHPRMGYSPDGLIRGEEENVFIEDIEIKSFEGAMYVECVLENKIPKKHYAQFIQTFIVNDKCERRYFVAYCPEIESYPLHIIKVERNDVQADIANFKVKELIFIKECEDTVEAWLEKHPTLINN